MYNKALTFFRESITHIIDININERDMLSGIEFRKTDDNMLLRLVLVNNSDMDLESNYHWFYKCEVNDVTTFRAFSTANDIKLSNDEGEYKIIGYDISEEELFQITIGYAGSSYLTNDLCGEIKRLHNYFNWNKI